MIGSCRLARNPPFPSPSKLELTKYLPRYLPSDTTLAWTWPALCPPPTGRAQQEPRRASGAEIHHPASRRPVSTTKDQPEPPRTYPPHLCCVDCLGQCTVMVGVTQKCCLGGTQDDVFRAWQNTGQCLGSLGIRYCSLSHRHCVPHKALSLLAFRTLPLLRSQPYIHLP
jgi:hypothetical protein